MSDGIRPVESTPNGAAVEVGAILNSSSQSATPLGGILGSVRVTPILKGDAYVGGGINFVNGGVTLPYVQASNRWYLFGEPYYIGPSVSTGFFTSREVTSAPIISGGLVVGATGPRLGAGMHIEGYAVLGNATMTGGRAVLSVYVPIF